MDGILEDTTKRECILGGTHTRRMTFLEYSVETDGILDHCSLVTPRFRPSDCFNEV
jgi:hypothetical protein